MAPLIPEAPAQITNQEWQRLLDRVSQLEEATTSSGPDLVVRHQDNKVMKTIPAFRGTRLPENWEPSDKVKDGLRLTFPNVKLGEILVEFRDYWCAVPGQRGLKLDWDRTFRNRVREVAHQPRFQRRIDHSVGDKVQGWLDQEVK